MCVYEHSCVQVFIDARRDIGSSRCAAQAVVSCLMWVWDFTFVVRKNTKGSKPQKHLSSSSSLNFKVH